MTDLRTLKLLGGTLEAAEVQQYIRYQRALLEALKHHPVTDWPGRLAFSHCEAARATGFDEHQLQRMRATVSQFCGRAWAVKELERRRLDAAATVEAAKTKGNAAPARQEQILERIDKESSRVADFSDFIERYGQQTFDVLEANEEALVTLHQALAHSEGKGHLHFA
jgi:chorismate mutase